MKSMGMLKMNPLFMNVYFDLFWSLDKTHSEKASSLKKKIEQAVCK